jgi:hypothetical protein
VVTDERILVRGLAPPGSDVTQDIPFDFDAHAEADAQGRWSIEVFLQPGRNDLRFRLGDDFESAVLVTLFLAR